MAMDISASRVLQVNVGIITVTNGGSDVPMVDKESPIALAFAENVVDLYVAGSVSRIAQYSTRQDLTSVTIPFIEAGTDMLTLAFGGVTGGGGPTAKKSTAVLIVTGLVGTFTFHAATPKKETTIEFHDEQPAKPAIQFDCIADLARTAGEQVWTFAPAA